MSRRGARTLAALTLAAAFGVSLTAGANAEAPQWRLEQPKPPELVTGGGPGTPIGLGRIGDVEFWAPNRGLLITDGNGSTVPPGVWDYNGTGWHELASVCGATDGRIAWAGPDEFWTISDGRPGQAANANGVLPPLEDNTLCRFSGGRVANSYASLAFQASSYQAMHAATCISSSDCWFAGEPLPAPQLGAFHLHWNGSGLEAEPNTRVDRVQDMRTFQGGLYESIALPLEQVSEGEETEEEILHPSVLQEVSPEGVTPAFKPLHPHSSSNQILPEYPPASPETPEFPFGSFPQALGFLHLSSDGDSLWAAAGPVASPPKQSAPGELTVLRNAGGIWSQVLGPETEHTAAAEQEHSGKVDPPNLREAVVNSIAVEPGTSSAWLALDTHTDVEFPSPTATARIVHVASDGSLTEEELPSASERSEGVGPKGAAYKLTCPAQNDCWLTTTQGWLFHLSEASARTLPADGDLAFNGALITSRPADEGLPQVQSDAPPLDDSGLEEFQPNAAGSLTKATSPNVFATVKLPLLSSVHTRLVHGTTLELSFHLAVKARVRLLAMRHSSVVAKTPVRTLKAGKRSLQLRLNPRRWPTKLNLQTHALAPLPTASSRTTGVETIGTVAAFPNADGSPYWGPLQ